MNIKTQNGRVLIKDGNISCSCCEELLDISIGEVADCECFYIPEGETFELPRPCFSEQNPAPETVVIDGRTEENPYAPFALYGGEFAIQIPWDFTTSPQQGWKSFVNQPTNVRLEGNVGGDVLINAIRVTGSQRYEGSPPEAQAFSVIPQENQYPCGDCGRNGGAHPFSYTWVMYPFTIYLLTVRTYLADVQGLGLCSPWLRARIRRLGAVAP